MPDGPSSSRTAAMDAAIRYEEASRSRDIDSLVGLLAPDAELVSPLVAHGVVRGQKDLAVLFEAVYGSLRDLTWERRLCEGNTVVMMGAARIGPFRIGDAAVVEVDANGAITTIRPHLRPWLATTAFALTVLVKLARHPGILARSWR